MRPWKLRWQVTATLAAVALAALALQSLVSTSSALRQAGSDAREARESAAVETALDMAELFEAARAQLVATGALIPASDIFPQARESALHDRLDPLLGGPFDSVLVCTGDGRTLAPRPATQCKPGDGQGAERLDVGADGTIGWAIPLQVPEPGALLWASVKPGLLVDLLYKRDQPDLRLALVETDEARSSADGGEIYSTHTGTGELEQHSSSEADIAGTPALRIRAVGGEAGLAQLQRDLFVDTLLVAVAVAAGVLIAGFLVSREIAHPVSALAMVAQRLREGDSSARAQARGPKEVHVVAAELNLLVEGLQEETKRLHELQGTLESRVRERTEALEEQGKKLQSANAAMARTNGVLASKNAEARRLADELRRRNEDLVAFAHIMSHDLKAPLRGIGLWASILRENVGGPGAARQREALDHLDVRVERAHRMIDEILEYARAGRAAQTREPFDSGALLRDTVKALDIPTGFHVRLPNGAPWIDGDADAVRRVFQNLVGNAFKHHDRRQGSVDVAWTARGDLVEFVVRDDGPGIPASRRAVIFKPFEAADRTRPDSTGLGLATARRLVEAGGGQLILDRSAGRGATFRVRLPQAAPPTRRAAAARGATRRRGEAGARPAPLPRVRR